jgi:hypothetical protein
MEGEMDFKMRMKLFWFYVKLTYIQTIIGNLWRWTRSIFWFFFNIFRNTLVIILSSFITYEVLASALLRKSRKSVQFLQELFDLNNDLEKALNKLNFGREEKVSEDIQEKLVKEVEKKAKETIKPTWLKTK